MAKSETIESGAANVSVSLPARGFEVGDLQSALGKGMKSLKDDTQAGQVARGIVEGALAEGQPSLDYDPATMPSYERVALEPTDEMPHSRSTLLYVPEDARPAAVRQIEAAQADHMALGASGKPVELLVAEAPNPAPKEG